MATKKKEAYPPGGPFDDYDLVIVQSLDGTYHLVQNRYGEANYNASIKVLTERN